MHLTFGTGLFWIIIASTAAEAIVRTAKALRGGKSAELADRVDALEQRLEQQARVITAHEEAVGRLEGYVELSARLLSDAASKAPAVEAPHTP